MRALVNLFVATLLLLNAPNQTNLGSSFTTTMSGMAAPYLPQPTAYVRPIVAQLVAEQRFHIFQVAHTYNQPAVSGMSDTDFASVLVMILYTEHHGWLEDIVPSLRPFTPAFQQLQVFSNHSFGTNFSVWPANLRPSVIDEIRNEAIASGRGNTFAITQPNRTSNDLANDPGSAIELLAANMARGIDHAHAAGVDVTLESILAWHNAGIVEPQQIRANRSVQHYISRALIYQSIARIEVSEAVACLRSQPF